MTAPIWFRKDKDTLFDQYGRTLSWFKVSQHASSEVSASANVVRACTRLLDSGGFIQSQALERLWDAAHGETQRKPT